MDIAKVLGQLAPEINTLSTLYTVPANSKAVVSTIKVCNREEADTTFRISIAVAGAADDVKQYLYYDVPLEANDTYSATEGWALGAGDVIRALASSTKVSFTVFGIEVTP